MGKLQRTILFVGFFWMVFQGIGYAEPSMARHFIAHPEGGQEVPEVDTNATGQVIFNLNETETELQYKLIVANIENVVASHIHLGPAGSNGMVVAFLAGPFGPAGGRTQGILAEGTITAVNLVGPLAGMDLSVLIQAMRTGGTYVNVHTNDGVPPTNQGPGDFPGGEIRGQVRPTGHHSPE
ncbi:MAG TPA: CHRD domain-containing protein [Candidatus Manganitrophaceae bacterium]|nr:CHRD domain-containing protein [Candidatus Manganitrophaceae bacterium]